jgi:hypothetical protein
MLFHIISKRMLAVKTNIGKPIKLYFKVYQQENKSGYIWKSFFSKDSFTINFSLKDPMLSQRRERKNI